MDVRCSVFIATSLDGFISRPDGALDWLDAANSRVPEGEDCGYSAFMAEIDCIVMGRKTFDKVLSFGFWPYAAIRVIVLSSGPIAIQDNIPATVSYRAGSPADITRSLASEGVRHIYVDGGETIRRFLDAGLIDDLTITTIPVLLGQGRALFHQNGLPRDLRNDVPLMLISSRSYDFGFVQTVYAVVRSKS